ncbi:hypothetical protein MKX01_028722, partial [Papaver californicum]
RIRPGWDQYSSNFYSVDSYMHLLFSFYITKRIRWRMQRYARTCYAVSPKQKVVVPVLAKDKRFGMGSRRIRWLIHTHQWRANVTANKGLATWKANS